MSPASVMSVHTLSNHLNHARPPLAIIDLCPTSLALANSHPPALPQLKLPVNDLQLSPMIDRSA